MSRGSSEIEVYLRTKIHLQGYVGPHCLGNWGSPSGFEHATGFFGDLATMAYG